jgi:WD40 repeat protein
MPEPGIASLAFTSDAKSVGVGGWDGLVEVWDLQSPPRRRETLSGHTSAVTEVLYSPDGRFLSSIGDGENTIRLWDVVESEALNTLLKGHLAAQGRALPGYVEREFEDYLKCGRLEHGFLRVRCDSCHAEHLVAFS